MIARDDATNRQIQAADPTLSTWLGANAGSGKTRVLTDRVARLLLDGVLPNHILCLTYTKAAASEMQNRLFKRLGDWAMRPNDELRKALQDLGVSGSIDESELRAARKLFASALETPGGLKIQTIHSFCAALLRRFPLEAGVSPGFTEIEDRAAQLLRAEIVEDIASGAQAPLLHAVARYVSGPDFDDLTKAIVSQRLALEQPMGWDDLIALFGLPKGYDEKDIVASVFIGGERRLLDALIPALQTGTVTDQKHAETLKSVGIDYASLPALESVLLRGKSAKASGPFTAKVDDFPTKNTREKITDLQDDLNDLMRRVEAARSDRLSLAAAYKSKALHDFAHVFLPQYAQAKQLRGWLDFDDLIYKAADLLNNKLASDWVLYKLDGGIDHILVDEAQDTSPAQWTVIERLAHEFTSGHGSRSNVSRTLFVVGDKKQSIYSFQGADPREFDRMREEFAAKLKPSNTDLKERSLDYSFRSSAAILRTVDHTFEGMDEAGFDDTSQHIAFKSGLPGRVDLWPFREKSKEDDDRTWYEPIDRRSPRNESVLLADSIAAEIRRLIKSGETIPDDKDGIVFRRPIRAGDFLILVQRRSAIFEEVIRACKALKLPVAGADRLKVGAEMAVKDLGALLAFLATPEDNLALATVLKSPLFGWTEQQLFDLSARRSGPYLWQALRAQTDVHAQTLTVLNDLRNSPGFLRPYDLIERVLTKHNGRQKLLARLGPEAEDGIDALLSQALAYEQSEVPSLTGFLVWMENDDLDIKRQIDSASDQIRVMTVHGAKGLEAPIVILPDTANRTLQQREELVKCAGTVLWKPASDDMPTTVSDAVASWKDAALQERLRLLYVAMTRAEKWLIVAGAGQLAKEEDGSWYQLIRSGMTKAGAAEHTFLVGEGLRVSDLDWLGAPVEHPKPAVVSTVVLPTHFDNKHTAPLTQKPHTPSEMEGPKALPGDSGQTEEQAKERGTQIHLLLEHLPSIDPDKWADLTPILLESDDIALCNDLLDEAAKVIKSPALAHVFEDGTLAEVPFTAKMAGEVLRGTIDRLIVESDRVLAIDFKSNTLVPDHPDLCPLGLLRQMAAYQIGLSQIYPQKKIETAIVWTKTAQLMTLPHDVVTKSLIGTPYLDDIAGSS
jgi:ATP-dependent helicase/nuclease subunit A